MKRGLTYFMFYTGVDDVGQQRIGLATSTDLVSWAQGDSIYDVPRAGDWIEPTTKDFRDPFVMADPNAPGEWLMYFAAGVDTNRTLVTGVARSRGDFTQWLPSDALWATRHPHPRVESPHVFERQSKWWLLYTSSDTVYAVSTPGSPSDTTTTNWSAPARLQSLVVDHPGIYYNWHATEYLEVSAANDIRYLAAYNDYPMSISITQMRPASPPYLFKDGCPSAASVDEPASSVLEPRLLLVGARPANSHAKFRIELPARMFARLAVYDVLGRRVRTLADRELAAGRTDLEWDGTNESGSRIGSGVYFIHLASDSFRRTIRLPLVR